MTDEYVAGHFANILQKAKIHIGFLQPGQLQITIDISAIVVAIT